MPLNVNFEILSFDEAKARLAAAGTPEKPLTLVIFASDDLRLGGPHEGNPERRGSAAFPRRRGCQI